MPAYRCNLGGATCRDRVPARTSTPETTSAIDFLVLVSNIVYLVLLFATLLLEYFSPCRAWIRVDA